MSKKIVILALHLGTGGAERVICNIANLLSESNNVKIISTYRLNEKPAFDLDDRVEIEYLMEDLNPNKQELIKSFKSLNLIKALKEFNKSIKVLFLRKSLMIKAIKNLDCDIAISTRILHNNCLSKYADKKIVKIAQEHNHHNNNQKYIEKLIKSLNGFDYFMPVSKELADFYENQINTSTKVVYIPNFIEYIPSENSSLQNKQLISVGRLDKVKGFDDLIEIFDLFQKKHPDWILHIVGEGSEKQNLQNKINELHLEEKVFLCGNKLGNELAEEYLNSSIYLMTSFSESFGLVLVEAASFGLPLIAFDSAQGAKEIIENDKNGFLISNRNKEKFIEKISEIIENHEKKNILSEHAIKTAKLYSKDTVSKTWNNFINNIEDKGDF